MAKIAYFAVLDHVRVISGADLTPYPPDMMTRNIFLIFFYFDIFVVSTGTSQMTSKMTILGHFPGQNTNSGPLNTFNGLLVLIWYPMPKATLLKT